MSSRRLRSLLLVAFTGVTVSHCRRADLCDGPASACASAGAAGSDSRQTEVPGQGGAPVGSAGQAGEAFGGSTDHPEGPDPAAGQAGAAATLECTKPQANCDESSLNGCETNVDLDPSHCGACNAPCDGLCASARCLPFEVLGDYDVRSNLAIAEPYVYFVTGTFAASQQLQRLDVIAKSEQILAQNLPNVDHVLLGADRAYLWSWSAGLWSVLNGSSLFVDEGIPLDWFTLDREYLFWVDGGTLHRRRAGAAPNGETAWRTLSTTWGIELAADDHQVLILQRGDTDSGELNRISSLALSAPDTTEPQLIVAEEREIVSWRLYDSYLYWVVRHAEGVRPYDELRRVGLFVESKPPELLLSAPRIEAFAVNRWVFASCPNPVFEELKAFEPSQPKLVRRIGLAARPEHLEVDSNGNLWLSQGELGRLLRGDVSWLE